MKTIIVKFGNIPLNAVVMAKIDKKTQVLPSLKINKNSKLLCCEIIFP